MWTQLLVLDGAVLLSGGRFDAAVAQGIPTAKGQKNISDIFVWAGDESGRNWEIYSVSYLLRLMHITADAF
jgi:hypothetical protein